MASGAGRDRADRSRLLQWSSHPALFVGVAVLVVNDHVLKARYPGWWTGKLSDFAGLAVVGIILAAALGLRWGLGVAGVVFSLLKLVPGVAESARPVLGGVTLRDPTDLFALGALALVWVLLRRTGRAASPARAIRARGIGAGLVAALTSAAPIVGLVLATAATTATSCGPSPAVVAVTAHGDELFALVRPGYGSESWKVSTDGGQHWHDSGRAGTPPVPTTALDIYVDPGRTGAQQACTRDGTCWRLRDRRSIERVEPGGSVTTEFGLSDAAFSGISTGCQGGSIGVLASIAATDVADRPHAVASLGADGALVRRPDGRWESVRVGAAPPVEPNRIESAAPLAVVAFGPVLAIALWLIGRHRWSSWLRGVGVAIAGWITTIMAASAITFIAGPATDRARVITRIFLPAVVLTTIAAFVVARLPGRARRLANLPPPPVTAAHPPPPAPPAESDDVPGAPGPPGNGA